MSDQLSLLLEVPTVPPLGQVGTSSARVPALVNLPCPVPPLGLECSRCETWPADRPRLRPDLDRRLQVICSDHGYGDLVIAPRWPEGLVRLEWRRRDGWTPVQQFTDEEGADANFRWPQYRQQLARQSAMTTVRVSTERKRIDCRRCLDKLEQGRPAVLGEDRDE